MRFRLIAATAIVGAVASLTGCGAGEPVEKTPEQKAAEQTAKAAKAESERAELIKDLGFNAEGARTVAIHESGDERLTVQEVEFTLSDKRVVTCMISLSSYYDGASNMFCLPPVQK